MELESDDDRRFFRWWTALSLLCLLLAAWRSAGYYHPDEQFQTLEFAGAKLGLTTPEQLPWEFAHRMRSWLQPALYVVAIGVLRRLGSNPFLWATALRVLSALYAWSAIVLLSRCCALWLGDRASRRTAIRLACSFCLLPFVLVRTSGESLATSSFFLGLALAELAGGRRGRFSWPFLTGVLFGLAFEFRFAVGLMVAGWFAWAGFVRRRPRRELLPAGLGVVAVVALTALVDRWGYGGWSLPPWNYLIENLRGDRAAIRFGSLPVWGYLTLALRLPFGPATSLAAAATAVAWIRHRRQVLTWCGLPMLLVHSLIAHKELRFLFPLLPAAAVSFGLAIAPGRDRLEPLARLLRGASTLWLRRLLSGGNAVALTVLCLVPVAPWAALQRFVYEELPRESELLVLGPETPYGPEGLVGRFYIPAGTTLRVLGAPELARRLRDTEHPANVVVPEEVNTELLAGHCREVYRSVPPLLDVLPGIRAADRWRVLRCEAAHGARPAVGSGRRTFPSPCLGGLVQPGQDRLASGLGVREPAHVGLLVSEPGELALGETHGVGHDRLLRGGLRQSAAHDRDRLAVADGLERARLGRQAASEQASRLVDQAARQHGAGPGDDGSPQVRPVGTKAHQQRAEALEGPFTPAPLEADGLACQREDLERAHHADPVARLDPGRRRRVHPPQEPVEPRVAVAFRDRGQPPAQRLVARGPLEETGEQGAQVEARPSGDDGQAPAAPDVLQRVPRQPRGVGGGEGLVRLDHVQQVVPHLPLLLRGRLGGADVQAAVDLLAVAGDDLAAPLARQPHGQGALARGGGTDDGQEGSESSRHNSSSRTAASSSTAPRSCCGVGRLTSAGAARARWHSRGRRPGCA